MPINAALGEPVPEKPFPGKAAVIHKTESLAKNP
jgi:hypothetical protein